MNKVFLNGTVKIPPIYSHSLGNKDFYKMYIAVERKSNNVDIIPVVLQETDIALASLVIGQPISITGDIRKKCVYAKYISECEKADFENNNKVELEGTVCKLPYYKQLKDGKELSEFAIEVQINKHKTTFVNVLVWGLNGYCASKLQIGEKVQIVGRMQSREYEINNKKLTAYEVSAKEYYKVVEHE